MSFVKMKKKIFYSVKCPNITITEINLFPSRDAK